MKNIISRLYYDELYPDYFDDKKQRKKEQLKQEWDKKHSRLHDSLSEKQKDYFNAWLDVDGLEWNDTVEAAFIRGFKIGALIGIEINNIDFDM